MKKMKFFKSLLTVLLVMLFINILSVPFMLRNTSEKNITYEEIPYSQFLDEVDNENIAEVVVNGTIIKAKTKEIENAYTEYTIKRFEDPNLIERLNEHDITYSEEYSKTGSILSIFFTVFQIGIMLVFLKAIFGKNNSMLNPVKSTVKKYTKDNNTGIKFDDVAGQDEAKDSLREIVDFLHNPFKYTNIGAKLPKGALLVGPPGTGKTLLAKAVAGEAEVPFYSLSGSDFVEMFVGVGAKRVRELFETANQNAPCIIFIDEIDAIGKARDSKYSSNDERENTLNQLLSEMDGFDASKGIIILGATNRPEILDKALLRPGRFDRRIIVSQPDIQGRVDILKVHAKDVLLNEDVDLKKIALSTAGASGADLANIINEAAIEAAKEEKNSVSQQNLEKAVEIVLVGKEKKGRVLNEKEKSIVAYHEIGHALATAVQKNTEPIQKITIIPRTMGALGFVMQTPEEERYLKSKDELEEMIITTLAGRAAEEVVFHSITTGASNDIEKATQIARAMITEYGMNDKFGLIGLVSHENQYLMNSESLNCSPGTAEEIDKEVIELLKVSYEKAKMIIIKNEDKIHKLASFLIEHETITGKQFMDIFHS